MNNIEVILVDLCSYLSSTLSSEDQGRVRQDVRTGRISPPGQASASTGLPITDPGPSSQAGPSQPKETRKRKASVSENEDNPAPPTTQIRVEGETEEGEGQTDEEQDEVYVAYATQVVGVQYYTGMVGTGELVSVMREPTNPYDRYICLRPYLERV